MDRLLRYLLQTYIRRGTFRVTTANGLTFTCGDGSGQPVAIRFTNLGAEWGLLLDPELKFGEGYVDGTIVVEQGTITDVLAIALSQSIEAPQWARLQFLLRYFRRRWAQFNPAWRARRNVAHHYDLDERLYALFLDADRQYSCAYFENLRQSLDDAQLAKKRHLTAKLLIEPGKSVLDIGCGWGGLALYISELAGAQVTGITLSGEQLAIANGRAAEKSLAGKLAFRLQDYRDTGGRFDRIVSVGMFEHVGVVHYDGFFKKCWDLLADEGVMVLHCIGRSEGPGITNPWISKYIFPGGYMPAVSEVMRAVEHSRLLVTDIEILRLHYAETIRHWRERFLAHRADVERIYDKRFVRMWEFYLAASEMSFREQNMMVMQIQLSKRQGIVPMTRDYIPREEQRLRSAELKQTP